MRMIRTRGIRLFEKVDGLLEAEHFKNFLRLPYWNSSPKRATDLVINSLLSR